MTSGGVRVAAADDACELARIQRETWRFAYSELLPSGALAALDGPELLDAVSDAIADPATAVYLATEGAHTVGWCVAGPDPDPDAAGRGLVGTLLVEPRWARRGHGGRLLDAALTGLAGRGLRRAVAWVPERDEASLRFYTKAGWEADGTVRTLRAPEPGRADVRELRLATDSVR
jgi:L-amino acid N-acyltransferase YncA